MFRTKTATSEPELPSDVTLTFADGKQLKTHGSLLKLASPVLRDALAHDTAGVQAHHKLPVGRDSYEGWQHVLSVIDPNAPLPELSAITLVSRSREQFEQQAPTGNGVVLHRMP